MQHCTKYITIDQIKSGHLCIIISLTHLLLRLYKYFTFIFTHLYLLQIRFLSFFPFVNIMFLLGVVFNRNPLPTLSAYQNSNIRSVQVLHFVFEQISFYWNCTCNFVFKKKRKKETIYHGFRSEMFL